MTTNVYYDPERFGLTVVGEIEAAGDYEFDTFVVWVTGDGRFVFAADSGCSCPTPFESVEFEDLREYSDAALDEWVSGYHGVKIPFSEVAELKRRVAEWDVEAWKRRVKAGVMKDG